jgi:hypothetical protein
MSTHTSVGLAISLPFSQTRVARSPLDDLVQAFRPATQASTISRGALILIKYNSAKNGPLISFFKKNLIIAFCQECYKFNYLI